MSHILQSCIWPNMALNRSAVSIRFYFSSPVGYAVRTNGFTE